MNLGKLVLLEVHGRVGNAKITKKYFSMLEWGVLYTVGELKRRAFQQAREHANQIPGLGDTALESLETKSREFPGVSQSDPHDPKGGKVLQRAAEAYVWGTSLNGGEKPLLVPLALAGKPLTRIADGKLGWVLGASTDVRAWIMSCPAPN